MEIFTDCYIRIYEMLTVKRMQVVYTAISSEQKIYMILSRNPDAKV